VTLLVAALAGLVYGAAHGLGPDHCAALATLLVGGAGRRRAVGACLRFGVGHAVVLGGLAAAAALSGFWVPAAWENAAEAVGGALLVLLGALALARALPLVLHRHAHAHDHGDPREPAPAHPHAHWHFHLGDRERHRHTHLLLGGVFALSGVRALAVVVSPLLLAGRSPESALSFLLGFGAGVTLAMLAFGLVFQTGRRALGEAGCHLSAVAVGGASLLLGAWWIWSSLS